MVRPNTWLRNMAHHTPRTPRLVRDSKVANGTRTSHIEPNVINMVEIVSPAPRNTPVKANIRANGTYPRAAMRKYSLPALITSASVVKMLSNVAGKRMDVSETMDVSPADISMLERTAQATLSCLPAPIF